MFGLVLAVVYSAYLYFTGHHSGEITINASTFLFYWYAVFAIISVGFALVTSVLFPLGGGLLAGGAAIKNGYTWGALLASLAGSFGGILVSIWVVLRLFLSASLKVGGAFLMSTSVLNGMSATPVWDDSRLMIGGLLLLLGLLFTSSSSSNSKSSSSDSDKRRR